MGWKGENQEWKKGNARTGKVAWACAAFAFTGGIVHLRAGKPDEAATPKRTR